MTEDETFLDDLTHESTRRSLLKTGALATAGAGIAGFSSGSGFAQQTDDGSDEDDGGDENWMRALMTVEQFRPDARFVITSPQLDWSPTVNGIQDEVWTDFNSRMIRYMNSSEQVAFWPTTEADLQNFDTKRGYVIDAEGDTGPNNVNQPEIYRMHAEYAPFSDTEYVGVQFTPVGEGEQAAWLEREDWWYADDDNPAGPDDFVVGLPYDENGTETETSGSPTGTENGTATGGD